MLHSLYLSSETLSEELSWALNDFVVGTVCTGAKPKVNPDLSLLLFFPSFCLFSFCFTSFLYFPISAGLHLEIEGLVGGGQNKGKLYYGVREK